MPSTLDPATVDAAAAFHGHLCPGLAIGLRAAETALFLLAPAGKNELVCVTETDMCGVDAIQFLTGCTLGKGNLVHRDYGKMAFSFFDRERGRGVRLMLRPEARGRNQAELAALAEKIGAGTATDDERERSNALRREMQQRLMDLDAEDMFYVQDLDAPAPRPPRILASLPCEVCGEAAMESRTRRFGGKTLCIPCFERVEQKL